MTRMPSCSDSLSSSSNSRISSSASRRGRPSHTRSKTAPARSCGRRASRRNGLSCQRKAKQSKAKRRGRPSYKSSGFTPVLWEARPRGESHFSPAPKPNISHKPAVPLNTCCDYSLKNFAARPKTFTGGLACLRVRRCRTGCSRGLHIIFNRLLKLTETMPIS